MDMDTMDMLHSPTAMLHTPTPMSTLTMASHTLTTHTPTMERDLLMLSQRPRLMLTHISSMVDTTDLTLIMPVTSHTPMDTHTPMDFGERSKSKLSDFLLK